MEIFGIRIGKLSCFGVWNRPTSPILHYTRERNSRPNLTYIDFTDECIAYAPLFSPEFYTNKRQVHQYGVSFAQGQLSEDWIKSIKRLQNEREDMFN